MIVGINRDWPIHFLLICCAKIWLSEALLIRVNMYVCILLLGHYLFLTLNDLVQEQGKVAELKGYTGKPIYSVWFGLETEERAVFVDELKCVGCLKCALFAEKTFAIESVYGRARVVAQWADPEHKIQEAIETCPVDCIS